MALLGVVFDFDGVIADTEALHLRAYREVLIGMPLSLTKEAYYEQYLGYDDVGVFTTLADDQGVELDPAVLTRLIQDKGKHFEALIDSEHVLFPGAAACVTRLAAVTPLGIASGALHAEIDRILTASGLRNRFQTIVAADDVSHPKPAPDSYLEAVARLGARDEPTSARCYVAIEDSPWGLQSARDAGLRTIAITNSYPAAKLHLADTTVASLDDIDTRLLQDLVS